MSLDCVLVFFFFQAEDGIRDAQESRGLGDVYKRQHKDSILICLFRLPLPMIGLLSPNQTPRRSEILQYVPCLLYTSDAADE